MALSSARPWRPRPRDYDGEIITASSEFISCPGPVTAITAEHRQLSGWWLLLWPSEVLMMICNYYTCLSPVLNRTFTAGAFLVKICIMFLMAPCGEYFSFSRNIEDTRQCLPQAGQGPARARRSQQRRKWGMLPPKILNTEAQTLKLLSQTEEQGNVGRYV